MKIRVTDEMMKHLPVGMSRHLLEDVFAIVERDYEISGGPIPDDAIRVVDKQGDVWDKLADERWVCIDISVTRDDVSDIKRDYGPLTW